ncbi:MAG: 1-acyl-sn-glycerol-3-phosphate acyltransferase [Spirochaetota bacterium]
MQQLPGGPIETVPSQPAPAIDVRSLFAAKNARLARRLPRWVVRGLELLIHQRELQQFVKRTAGCSGCELVEAALAELEITIDSDAIDSDHIAGLPDSPHIVVCANHPTGGVDGLVLMHVLCTRYGGLRLPANDLLLALPGFSDVIAPVDKYASNASRAAVFEEMYRSDVPVLVFPAGRTARFYGGRLREYRWNKAFIKHARRRHRRLIPVHVSGRNSRHFYAIWHLRRALRIKPNLEMFLLVDELARRRGDRVRVTIGAPVDPSQARGPQEDYQLAQRLRLRVERGRP